MPQQGCAGKERSICTCVYLGGNEWHHLKAHLPSLPSWNILFTETEQKALNVALPALCKNLCEEHMGPATPVGYLGMRRPQVSSQSSASPAVHAVTWGPAPSQPRSSSWKLWQWGWGCYLLGGMLGMLLLTAEDSIPPPLWVNEERDPLATSWEKTCTHKCVGLTTPLTSTLDTGWSPAPGPKSWEGWGKSFTWLLATLDLPFVPSTTIPNARLCFAQVK